jgi:DNA-binding CsgD family transcriptional regulator
MHAGRARAMAVVAQAHMLRMEREEAIAWADETMELAERLGLPDVRLAAQVEKGSALVNDVRGLDEGRLLLNEAADEAEKAGEWLLAARALNNLLDVPYPRSPTELAEMLERMRADAEKAGLESLAVATYYQGRARLAMQEGDLGTATAAIEEARERDRGAVRSTSRGDYHGALLAGLALEGGNLDLAESILSVLLVDPSKKGHLGVPGLAFHLACRRGDRERAGRELATVLRVAAQSPPTGDHLHDLVAAAVHIGLPPAQLRALVERGFNEAESFAAWGWLVEAQLAEAEHRPADALADYVRAAEAGELPPAPRGSAHAGAARCLIALGRIDEARAHVLDASALVARWGGWRVAEVDALRGRVGLRDSTVDSTLTPREREVAQLLAEGLTNAELARRLYISPKTAAVHVSNILSKLDLSSRTQVGEALGGLRST